MHTVSKQTETKRTKSRYDGKTSNGKRRKSEVRKQGRSENGDLAFGQSQEERGRYETRQLIPQNNIRTEVSGKGRDENRKEVTGKRKTGNRKSEFGIEARKKRKLKRVNRKNNSSEFRKRQDGRGIQKRKSENRY